jgi:hypothetical protein
MNGIEEVYWTNGNEYPNILGTASAPSSQKPPGGTVTHLGD